MSDTTGLSSLGFTDLEAALYEDLLRQAPATGYRLSQRIGKSPANVYQALKSMEQKSAVLASDSSDPLTYVPVPPKELLAKLKRDFDARHDVALQSLSAAYQPVHAENFFHLRTVQNVIERARAMLLEAQEIVLFDFFPAIFDLFAADIKAAQARGVVVAGIAYRKEHSGPLIPFNAESAELVGTRWPGLGLLLVADGSQQLIAQLSLDMQRVLNGLWTNSVFQSCIFHSAVAADIRLIALRQDPSDPLRILSLQRSAPPGLKMLLGEQAEPALDGQSKSPHALQELCEANP